MKRGWGWKRGRVLLFLALFVLCSLARHCLSVWPGVLQYSQMGNGLFIRYLFLRLSLGRCQKQVRNWGWVLRSL